jgi:hypothetical protein
MKNGLFTHIQPGNGVIYPPRGLPAICSPITVGFYMDDEISGWRVENNTFIDCQTAMLLGGGRDAIIVNNHIESCPLGLAFEYAPIQPHESSCPGLLLTLSAAASNRGMNWERHSNCPLALSGLNKTLAGPAGKAYASRWPEMAEMVANPTCNPVHDMVAHNTYKNTTKFCSASAAIVESWSAGTSRIYNNTDLSPRPPPVPPPPPCHNATRVGPYLECSFTVMIGARDSSHVWQPQETAVKADHDDCFRMEGCGVSGASGRSCMKNYKDKAQLLVTRNGTTVGEGHCCVPSVKDYV